MIVCATPKNIVSQIYTTKNVTTVGKILHNTFEKTKSSPKFQIQVLRSHTQVRANLPQLEFSLKQFIVSFDSLGGSNFNGSIGKRDPGIETKSSR